MRKNIMWVLIGFLLFPLSVFAVDYVDYDITQYKVEADIKSNGDVNVCEYIKQTGSFNGYVRDIYYKDGDATYTPTGMSNINVYDLNVDNMSKGEAFSLVNYASKGDKLKYTVDNNTYGPSITMFNANSSGSKGYVLCYTLENSVLVHNDVAEFYYNFIPNGFEELLENVSVKVNLPTIDDSLRVWAHGALYGSVFKENSSTNSYLIANISYVNPGEVVNVRMTFDKNLVSDSTRYTNNEALDKIISDETKLAENANKQRETERNVIIFSVVLLICLGGMLIIIMIYCYKKYDKEYNVDFDMEYYRDFPNTYGPETLEYLLKKKITTDAYSASILNMIYKKCIMVESTESKKDYILTKAENFVNPLTGLEGDILNFLFYTIGDGKTVSLGEIKRYGKKEKTAKDFLNHFDTWKNNVINDAEQYNFFEKNKKFVPILLIVIITFISTLLFMNISEVLSVIAPIIGIISIAIILRMSKKTKSGMLEYKKWQSFKKFLTDFGRFDEKELPEIILWEKYLVYATIFGVADKLEKTMKIKIESFDDVDLSNRDIIYMNHTLRNDFTHTMNSTISNVYTASRSTIAASEMSSGSGSGGGFSGGGSFSGGGGGGGGHGF